MTERSFREIQEGALPFKITYEDTEKGITLEAEGRTREEAEEILERKKRAAVN